MTLGGREEPDNQTDIDRRFAEIVAQFEPAGQDDPDAPDAEAGAPDEPGMPEPSPLAGLPTQWRMPPSGAPSFLEDFEDDTFVPAPPQPLPSSDEDLGFWTMLGCLIGGPLWLLYLLFFDRYAQSLWWVLACAVFVAGVVQLIMRSPKNRDDDPDDDGAVL
ncbi:hypothetical protein [Flexivirga caeni]|uniref:Uncharacterized protein n=1 Tax=Flexivirga caeni TaxID=2294115 RepID=A0A3M9MHU2_9MICO|nr:hypothetical protein [Flexivirga caeni]RNI24413.1 hypothetical protein EFY87_05510 [Flexivirga caeni]